jgi:NADH-quinone oxidoreductase subunit J
VNALIALAPVEPFVAAQIGGASLLGALGVAFLLPRPRGRNVPLGVFLTIAAAVVAVGFVATTFGGKLATDNVPALVEQGLFWLFSLTALSFGVVLVTQANPARGAIAFAFVVLSTCGLFLLLAAPFLMAATVIIYAGAIIVTFLFVLMLSSAKGPSDENDRSREPLVGSLAGFAFAGLVFLTLTLSVGNDRGAAEPLLPAAAIRPADKRELLAAADELAAASKPETDATETARLADSARTRLAAVVGLAPAEFSQRPIGRSLQDRLRHAETDARAAAVIAQADALKASKHAAIDRLENATFAGNADLADAKADLAKLREDALVLAGRGELPAYNVSAVGYALYSDHLVAVELAGTLLLVATIGAVAIAGRRQNVLTTPIPSTPVGAA